MRTMRICFSVILVTLLLSLALTAQAAGNQEQLKVDLSVDRADIFWNTTFITRDDEAVGKPFKVVVKSSLGMMGQQEKSETALTQGKKHGLATIVTDKNELVNLEISLYDAQNNKLGTMGVQVRNSGQTEYIVIAPPDTVAPQFTRSNDPRKTPTSMN